MIKEKIYEAVIKAKDEAFPNGDAAFYDATTLVRWLNAPKRYINKTARLAVVIAGTFVNCCSSGSGIKTFDFMLPSTAGAIYSYYFAKKCLRNHRCILLDGYMDGEEVELILRR